MIGFYSTAALVVWAIVFLAVALVHCGAAIKRHGRQDTHGMWRNIVAALGFAVFPASWLLPIPFLRDHFPFHVLGLFLVAAASLMGLRDRVGPQFSRHKVILAAA